MKRILILTLIFTAVTFILRGQVPDWATSIAPIIYNNCSSCHHEGGIGPFTLMSYNDAFVNAYSIQAQVESKKMPPWMPDPNYVHFKDERFLEQPEIDAIAEWVNAGMPSGDLSQAPPAPVFVTQSQMDVIDQSIQLPAWTVNSDVDQYRTFVVQNVTNTTLYLNQLEFIPSNNAVVHHVVAYADPTNQSLNKDLDDPLPGFESNGVSAPSLFASFFGAWAPGAGVFELPGNMGIKIPANTDFAIELHYSPNTLGQIDSTIINLKYTSDPNVREVFVDAVLEHFFSITDGPLYIPANTTKTFHEKFTINGDHVSVVGTFPHMHKIGSNFKSWALDPAGDTRRLINIPDWDFHWQGFYMYQKLIPLFDGTEIWAEAMYDNTTNNPDNPNNPPVDVYAGEQTTDEMMIEFFAYLPYEPGDEDIILDSTIIALEAEVISGGIKNVEVYPNPATVEASVGINIDNASAVNFYLYDVAGRLLWENQSELNKGFNTIPLSLEGINTGIYSLHIVSQIGIAARKFVKQ